MNSNSWTGIGVSPIILDLDGDGVETVSYKERIFFDHDGDRFAQNSGWVGSDDALLVRDLNGDGIIDSGAELFGDNTILKSGWKAQHGFAALAELDSSGDGVIDANDDEWNDLQLWQDKNSNGKVDAGELMSLDDADVSSLNVDYGTRVITDSSENIHVQHGSYVKTDGTTADMTDVWFVQDPPYREDLDSLELPADYTTLPDVKGYGKVRDLHQAMFRDESGELRRLVEEFAAEPDSQRRRELAVDIVLHWTKSNDPSTFSNNIISRNVDIRHAHAIFKFFGHNNDGFIADMKPTYTLNKAFDTIVNYAEAVLNAQTHVAEYAIVARYVVGMALGDGTPFDTRPLVEMLRIGWDSGDAAERAKVKTFLAQFGDCGPHYSELMEAIRNEFAAQAPSADQYRSGDLTFEQCLALAGYDHWDRKDLDGVPHYYNNVDFIVNHSGESSGNLYLDGSNGDDLVYGGAGDDNLRGNAGDDILDGGAGNDTLNGGAGDNIYIFGLGGGHDTAFASDNRAGKRNVVRLTDGIGPDDIDLLLDGQYAATKNLIIRLKATDETLTLYGATSSGVSNANNSNSFQVIQFADGTVWEWDDIRGRAWSLTGGTTVGTADTAGGIIVGNSLNNILQGDKGNDTLHGGDGSDTLSSGGGDDILDGGAGNDTLDGGAGDDILDGGAGEDRLFGGTGDNVYLFDRGSGHDTAINNDINVEKHNVVRLGAGITTDDIELQVARSGDYYHNLVIRIKDSGDTLTLQHAVSANLFNKDNPSSFQAIEFADGTVWDWETICGQSWLMRDGTNSVTAQGEYAANITGGDGNDTIRGSAIGSILSGGDGNDAVYGGAGNDVLQGGDGDDRLQGGAGDDIIHGGAGKDTLDGGAGSNVFVFGRGDGHDEARVYDTDEHRRNAVRLTDLNPDDIEFLQSNSGSTQNLVIRIKDTGETLALYGAFHHTKNSIENSYSFQTIEFADGTAWEWEDIVRQPVFAADGTTLLSADVAGSILYGGAGNERLDGGIGDDALHGGAGNDALWGNIGADALSGGDGDDTLYGEKGGDTLHGGAGDDVLNGGEGDDVYVFGRGDGHDTIYNYDIGAGHHDVIRFGAGIGAGDLEFIVSQSGGTYADLIIRLKATGETIKVISGFYTSAQNASAIQGLEFADGTKWTYEDIMKQPFLGDETSKSFRAYKDGSILIGNALDNYMSGSACADTLHGGAGNDSLRGDAGNDILAGGSGNDTLIGGAGDDVYIFNKGDGHDMINNLDAGAGRHDVIRFGEGITAGDLEFIVSESNGRVANLIICLKSTGETITVQNGFSSAYTPAQNGYSIQGLEFSDGTKWTYEDIMKQPILSDETSKSLYADKNGSTLIGNALDNYMSGSAFADTLYGGAGNDSLRGDAGNDILAGGSGNDTLIGGTGDDVYIFNVGDGHDMINNLDAGAGRHDVIRFGEGIVADDLEFIASNPHGTYADLVIRLKSTGETITMMNGFSSAYTAAQNGNSIQGLEFSDGTKWTYADIMKQPMLSDETSKSLYADKNGSTLIGNALDNYMSGSAFADTLCGGEGNDILRGDASNDILIGGSGNDTLNGGADDDTYVFNSGDGMDTITEQSGTDKLVFGDGIDISDLWFERSGNDLVIDVLGREDQVNVNRWFSHPEYQVETITAGDMELVNTQMNQMLQAMAGFGVPEGVDGRFTEEQKEAMAPVLSTYWKPTGS